PGKENNASADCGRVVKRGLDGNGVVIGAISHRSIGRILCVDVAELEVKLRLADGTGGNRGAGHRAIGQLRGGDRASGDILRQNGTWSQLAAGYAAVRNACGNH